MNLNFVLIDFENVQPLNLEKLRDLPVEIRVFLGANQPKVAIETVQSLQPFGKSAEYVRISGSGKNALDFHIAFYLGQLAHEHPKAKFHIVSKDTGFDPLVAHLKDRRIACWRFGAIEDLPLLKKQERAGPTHAPPAKNPKMPAIAKPQPKAEERFALAKALLAPQLPRPKTMAKLRNVLTTHFRQNATPAEIDTLVRQLKSVEVFAEEPNGKLTYRS